MWGALGPGLLGLGLRMALSECDLDCRCIMGGDAGNIWVCLEVLNANDSESLGGYMIIGVIYSDKYQTSNLTKLK